MKLKQLQKALAIGVLAITASYAAAAPIFSFTERAGFEDDVAIAVYTDPLVPGGINPLQTTYQTMSWVEGFSPQSSLDLDNYQGAVTPGVWTSISTITHTNNLIPGATNWGGQDIWGRLIITDSQGGAQVRVDDTSPITIGLTETLNVTPCPVPNPVGTTCDDFWGFTASGLDSFTFTANDGSSWLAEFQFANLVNAAFLNGVVYTGEARVSSLDVQMRLTSQGGPTTVPEPTTLGILGLGLLGLGIAKRRKQNI